MQDIAYFVVQILHSTSLKFTQNIAILQYAS